MTQSNTFFCEYQILPNQNTRDTCMTLFGGMTKQDDLNELQDVTLLGRWSCVGEARGFCIAQAKSVASMQKWLNNWVPMADIKVTPCLDDNEQRRLILKQEPPFTVHYTHVGAPPKDNESLYFIKYQFKHESLLQGFEMFSSMSKEQDSGDSGKCTSYGRWHVPSLGCGYAIASSPSVFDIYKWAFNWKELCDCTITPVTHDEVTRQIIKQQPGFEIKHKAIMGQMAKLYEQPTMLKRFLSCFMA